MKKLALVFAWIIALAACGGTQPAAVQGAGAGGAGGAGGGGGSAQPQPDTTPPLVEILRPADGDAFTTSSTPLQALLTDEVGVVAVHWAVNDGAPQPLRIPPGEEVPLELEVPLQLGPNAVRVGALDAAGNEGVATLLLHRVADQGAPEILSFTVDDWDVEPGDEVQLSWAVRGAAPLALRITPHYAPGPDGRPGPTGAAIDVAGRQSLNVRVDGWTRFVLYAGNAFASASAEVRVETDPVTPRIEPRGAVLVAGVEQRFRVANLRPGYPDVYRWNDGVAEDPAGKAVRFSKDLPGRYTLRVSEANGLSDEVQVEVIAAPAVRSLPPFIRQAGTSAYRYWLAPDDTLWALSWFDKGLLRWNEADASWEAVAPAPSLENPWLTSGPGAQPCFVSNQTAMWCWDEGNGTWIAEALPPEGRSFENEDGSVLLLSEENGVGRVLRRGAAGRTWDPVGPLLPAGFVPWAAAQRADGSLVVTGREADRSTTTWGWRAPSEAWIPLPSPVQADVNLLASGDRVFAWGPGVWELAADEGTWTDRSTGLDQTVSNLAVGPGGVLFASAGGHATGQLHSDAAGTFTPVAEALTGLGYFDVRRDGTVISGTGHRLDPPYEGWRPFADRGLPPPDLLTDLQGRLLVGCSNASLSSMAGATSSSPTKGAASRPMPPGWWTVR
ncbi:hypothetical protein [Vulgatibacter sp.]|uniref:hypothetical protein n=1 Tax=Vulgatibacter sp. TaxID=1971226 RepID=UPI003565EA65